MLKKSRLNKGVAFTLKDGTSVLINALDATKSYMNTYLLRYGILCDNREYLSMYLGTNSNTEKILEVLIDVNGKKGPNIAGKDVYSFIYTKSHDFLPAGVDSNNDTSTTFLK